MHESFPGSNELFLLMSDEDVRHAVTIVDRLIEGSPDGGYDWAGNDAHHAVTRMMTEDGTDALFIGKIVVNEATGHVTAMRYILDIDARGFLVVPGMYDSIDDMGTDDDPDLNQDTFAMMFELGQHMPAGKDWDDMIDILNQGILFQNVERSARVRLGNELFSEVLSLYVQDDPVTD